MIRAAIYARVSTSRQAGEDKVSISEQIAECEALCADKGYTILETYVDSERYRAGSRMVEPSGTRSDRPAFRRMLKAAVDGELDRIIAWREDRLARGIYAAVPLGRVLEETSVKVEVVHGTFDYSFFYMKAAIGKLELDAIKERTNMGISAKLKTGAVWEPYKRYGYQLDDTGHLILDPERAQWVRQIYQWYADGIAVREIRRRLIAADAPRSDRRSRPKEAAQGWSLSTIRHILTSPEYWQGFMVARRAGKTFEIPCPPIITENLFLKVRELRKENQSHAAGLVKGDFLAQGLVYCTCGLKWAVRTVRFRGRGVPRKTPLGKYFCPGKSSLPDMHINRDCPTTIGSKKLDDFIWDALVQLLQHPERVQQAIDAEIEARGQEPEALEYQRDLARIERDLAQLPNQRNWTITMARKGAITEEQMGVQLRELDELELVLIKERNDRIEPVSKLEELKALALNIGNFLKELDPATDLLTSEEIAKLEPETRAALFQDRRKLVLEFVDQVTVHRDAAPSILFKFNSVSGAFDIPRCVENAIYRFSLQPVDVP